MDIVLLFEGLLHSKNVDAGHRAGAREGDGCLSYHVNVVGENGGSFHPACDREDGEVIAVGKVGGELVRIFA